MQVDRRAIQPFNEWWRKFARQASPPQDVRIIEAFAAGFKAGLKCGVEGAMAVVKGETK